MVTSEYHTQKLKTRNSLINNAEPIEGGKGEETRGKATSRGSKGPKGVAAQVMCKIILLARAAKDTGKKWDFTHPVRGIPRACAVVMMKESQRSRGVSGRAVHINRQGIEGPDVHGLQVGQMNGRHRLRNH